MSSVLPAEEQVHPGYGEEMQAVEHPADGTWSPPLTSDIPESAPSRTPPRRAVPGG